ncbi:LysR family transcriptional regulator [Tatumella sp. UBA2305]|uniref:LysR family transcriptional regulator n=1 Tax=Tatumella sp. UBA2305 TaxID=1947647 RepID=UPI0025E29E5E|nr:LysR family transcriptional regulator [Tatumella sp. UBA2305]
MEAFTGITFFVQAAEWRSFSEAGRVLGVSASAVGKSIARLEEKLGVSLFNRSTRSITLTNEGALFLERCRRILSELEAAESELTGARSEAKGKLRVSLPLVSRLVMPVISGFMRQYPKIELDLDFTDRLVDVIEEGFDAVIRSGDNADSRLKSRTLGYFSLQLVASPRYAEQHGLPERPEQLTAHACLQHKFPETGKFEPWPLLQTEGKPLPALPATMICNTTEVLLDVVREGFGIACLPDFMVKRAIQHGELLPVLPEATCHQGVFRILWPSHRYPATKLRVFIDYMAQHLLPETARQVLKSPANSDKE